LTYWVRFQWHGKAIRRSAHTTSKATAQQFLAGLLDEQFSKRHIRESPLRTTYPTAEQVDQLVANAPPMTGRIIRFLAETGMRQEEVCGLEWSQVSIQRQEPTSRAAE
jgi:integrase